MIHDEEIKESNAKLSPSLFLVATHKSVLEAPLDMSLELTGRDIRSLVIHRVVHKSQDDSLYKAHSQHQPMIHVQYNNAPT